VNNVPEMIVSKTPENGNFTEILSKKVGFGSATKLLVDWKSAILSVKFDVGRARERVSRGLEEFPEFKMTLKKLKKLRKDFKEARRSNRIVGSMWFD
jgi:2-hydroxy-3-keto-5-methylthiopentenyl-1-phosphate phosphatase